MSLFELAWIFRDEPNEPKKTIRKSQCGFDAEVEFLEWSKENLSKAVKVVRVEKVA